MPRPDALILDYGEVLSLPQRPDAIARMAALFDVAPEVFAPVYWRHRRAYDLGLPAADYWQRVATDLSIDTAPRTEALTEVDVDSWMSFREDVWELAREARAAGIRTAVLSNGIRDVLARLDRERPLPAHFDVVVISYEVGCAKPDAQIYEITLDRLGVAADRALFVDDRVENIEGARRVGIGTLHFTGADPIGELRRRMRA